jgi:hypothetical protein
MIATHEAPEEVLRLSLNLRRGPSDINDSNAAQLGFAWAYDMGTERGQEATPLVIDGVMYTSGVWGIVYALDAVTGKLLWLFDPGIDPASAARIHPRDAKRIIRALEVAETTGQPLSHAFSPASNPLFESRLMVVDLPRAVLYGRIDRRVERMFVEGLVEETRAALAHPGGIGPTARQAAGYTEAIELLEGRIDLPAAIRRTQQRTRQLAKRQLTWLRSFSTATWVAA